ncbi:WD-repeat-containing protein [Multifurca ochricompacta]|uniref:WD-repeat-containing protein n=1 Tax=Multifurca ochricompacta TaxID=376703 RepID=A0AAD4QR57_9AGAM|nr:WD-repeat-containing protein [Multifurca ochricompacta]
MVQTYSRHGPTQAFGLVCSPSSNSVYDGKLAYVPALEDVLVWDVKTGQMVAMWHETGHRVEVTCMERSPKGATFAVGYTDGSIRLWDVVSKSVFATFNGHKRAITALAFDDAGARLASGSQDTDLIMWDVVGEAGMFRLRGHRDQITNIRFLSKYPSSMPSTSNNITSCLLVSSSKDTFVKIWDLSTQHCVQTIVAHRSEVWSLSLNSEQDMLLTGSNEGELKAWRIEPDALKDGIKELENGELSKAIHPVSTLPLTSSHRVSQIAFHPTLPYLFVQSHDRSVEIFRVRTDDEIRKKHARRKRRADAKGARGKSDNVNNVPDSKDVEKVELADLFTPYLVVRATGKIKSFALSEEARTKGATQLFFALSNNAMDPPEAVRLYSLDLPGHRMDVRTLSLSSDDNLLASASNGALKIWNTRTTSCIRTLECGHSVCSSFLPGDEHVVIGTKSGEMQIFNLSSSALVENIKAHTGTLWSIHIRPDQQALVTGSADKDVKFWNIDWGQGQSDGGSERRTVSLVHTRTLKMTDDVLSVRYSPNGRLLAVALLDSTVKVFYEDTLKFFLSLYGHKLPVLSMDISYDSKLIVTSSADKNVKIWGLDFGDCHKSIFAHDESVMQVAFEKKSHYFWTVGKDKVLKYWDGDKFENIQKLEGHFGEIWALAVSNFANFVVTGSHDKSIRIWEKLDEPLFLEEEREHHLEQLYESGLADTLNREDLPIGSGDPTFKGPERAEATNVSKQTTETLMAGERISEALELADREIEARQLYEKAKEGLSEQQLAAIQPPPRNPVLVAHNIEPEAWVLKVVEGVQSAALHDALLVLPLSKVISLMIYLSLWAEREWNIPLISRILFFLLKTHHHQIVANRAMRTTLIPLRTHLRAALLRQKSTITYNLAALQFIRRQSNSRRTAQFYDEAGLDEGKALTKITDVKKRKRVDI